ncbi:DUF6164 family protein [Pseudomarimonas arenosa]|uniref:DUF2007 domain-containing protein n=1 Tax=Pseudomarimonas arenosa TaxID=2774145 RepID=A0AAW3ZED5_9GAMM|nr:DUF6164 family protein [Pseudomarimonas arenosa]MBD8524508.1 hypothetical protein [Pseudomarimonas arenosa]
MPKLLLNLRAVPEDECIDVLRLLEAANIEHYMTPASRWGISHGGIWLVEETDWERAKQLFDQYQNDRREHARRTFADDPSANLWSRLRAEPLRMLVLLTLLLMAIGLALLPFVWLVTRG